MIAALCLALAMYHEARSDGAVGMLAVGQVVMNRVEDSRWPDNACDVVKQGGEQLHRCQFSFWCDGRSDTPYEAAEWRRAVSLAQRVIDGEIVFVGLLSATCYHARWMLNWPYWASEERYVRTVGEHRFYQC